MEVQNQRVAYTIDRSLSLGWWGVWVGDGEGVASRNSSTAGPRQSLSVLCCW